VIELGQKHYVLFDGDCGFCHYSADHIRAMDTGKSRFEVISYQSIPEADLLKFGVTYAACDHQLHVISRRGGVWRGPFAINFIAFHFLPWTILVILLYLFPIFILFEMIGYRLVARYRGRISVWLGLTACRLPVKEKD